VDGNKLPLKMVDVLFRVHLLARIRNDFTLQPFASDGEGIVTILKKELEAEVQSHYDSGVMDYAHVSTCSPSVEIRLLSVEDIEGAIKARRLEESSRW
jgi:hypothetical protein